MLNDLFTQPFQPAPYPLRPEHSLSYAEIQTIAAALARFPVRGWFELEIDTAADEDLGCRRTSVFLRRVRGPAFTLGFAILKSNGVFELSCQEEGTLMLSIQEWQTETIEEAMRSISDLLAEEWGLN